MKKSHRGFAARGIGVLSLVLLVSVASPATAFDLVPYQATGWSYLQVVNGDPVESVFMQPAFDDASWALGRGAFGGVGYGCPVEATVHTHWDTQTDMLLRRWFHADPGGPLYVRFGVDNDAKIWINGVLVADVVHEGCALLDEWSVLVPPAILSYGSNLIAVQAVDRHVIAYFDLRIEGDMPVPVHSQSWGRLKLSYR